MYLHCLQETRHSVDCLSDGLTQFITYKPGLTILNYNSIYLLRFVMIQSENCFGINDMSVVTNITEMTHVLMWLIYSVLNFWYGYIMQYIYLSVMMHKSPLCVYLDLHCIKQLVINKSIAWNWHTWPISQLWVPYGKRTYLSN